jgi:hypothetical protein
MGRVGLEPRITVLARTSSNLAVSQSDTASNHSNVFTLTQRLSEGRASITWEPSNKMVVFLPFGFQVR